HRNSWLELRCVRPRGARERSSASDIRWRRFTFFCKKVREFLSTIPISRAHARDPEKRAVVFPRDKRGTRLRGDHAQPNKRNQCQRIEHRFCKRKRAGFSRGMAEPSESGGGKQQRW